MDPRRSVEGTLSSFVKKSCDKLTPNIAFMTAALIAIDRDTLAMKKTSLTQLKALIGFSKPS